MKRSKANSIIEYTMDALKKAQFPLPPFAYYGPEEWANLPEEEIEVVENMLCWDITDFGSGDFDRVGLTIFTFRNGNFYAKEKYPKPYRHLMRSVNNGWEQAEQYLRKGMEEGLIREVSIPVVMAMVKGTVICFMESDVLYQNELTYEQAKKEMVEILMKGIKAGGKS